MSRFNLIDEPWIPVRFPDGSRAELGIRDTLLRAKDIAVIEDPSPLVVASLHRFLLAVLYRALEGPTDINQAKGWFKAGLPANEIDAYLGQWRERFWLFDEKKPFFQVADFKPKKWNAWTVLAAEHNANNAKILFDHINVTRPGDIPENKAVRWVLAIQTFALGGGNSEFQYTKGAPSTKAAMFLPLGRTLEDTLLLCLVPQNRAVIAQDLPIWERDPDTADKLKSGAKRSIAGFADRYTWRTRSIHLRGDEVGNVSTLAFASGVESSSKDSLDPMLAYRIDKDKGRLPIQFKDRGLWRDFDTLMPDDTHLAPAVIEHAAALTRFARDRFPQSVLALGLANNPRIEAKIEYWRMERFALPQALLGDRAIRTEIYQLLTDAEQTQKALWQACRRFARDLLSRGEREPDAKDIGKFVEQMTASTSYWSRLEAAFHDTLRHYTLERDADDIRLDWLKAVRAALHDTWAQHAASVSTGDAWAIRALVRAEGTIGKQIKALIEEIKKYETRRNPQEETA
ncbi:MAG: type I-E CRISPR-associated protein Cse1/CasA [Gammaproteobacteria bacterium]|nr:type I-E CRISPR-associated protein Cse1/CasA [Gammaproteobacteria bacterium]